jgi:hypothetical protein
LTGPAASEADAIAAQVVISWWQLTATSFVDHESMWSRQQNIGVQPAGGRVLHLDVRAAGRRARRRVRRGRTKQAGEDAAVLFWPLFSPRPAT